MEELKQWVLEKGLTNADYEELEVRLLAHVNAAAPAVEISHVADEAYVQSKAQLNAAAAGVHLWRNNVGACKTERGRLVRYGLANASKRQNEVVKSSDLIGIRPVDITVDMVGKRVGVFVARECKEPSWTYSGSDREEAQLRFIKLIRSLGGDARFLNDEEIF